MSQTPRLLCVLSPLMLDTCFGLFLVTRPGQCNFVTLKKKQRTRMQVRIDRLESQPRRCCPGPVANSAINLGRLGGRCSGATCWPWTANRINQSVDMDGGFDGVGETLRFFAVSCQYTHPNAKIPTHALLYCVHQRTFGAGLIKLDGPGQR